MTAKITDSQAIATMRGAGVEPLMPYPGSQEPWKCRCNACGREIFPRLGSIKAGQGACKFCAGHRTAEMAHSEMLQLGFEPLERFPGTNKKWKCKCIKCGHVSSPRMNNVLNGSKCFECAKKENTKARSTPEHEAIQVMQAANLTPLTAYARSTKPWLSRCNNCQRMVSPTLSSVKKGGGCAYCGKRRLDPHEAEKLLVSMGAKPQVPYPGSHNPWRSICLNCEREIKPRFADVRKTGTVCAFCSGNRIDISDALIVLKEKSLEPIDEFPGSGKPWRCRCIRCGEITSPTLYNLKTGTSGCASCAGRKVSSKQALELMRKSKIRPLDDRYPGSKIPWPSICEVCNNSISPTYGSILRGSSCRYCNVAGIKYNEPGFLYFISNTALRAHKIGIANTKSDSQYHDRLKQHLNKGWVLIERINFRKTQTAYDLEQGMLDWVRIDLNLPHFLPQSSMPQGGYTETFSSGVPIEKVLERLKLLREELLEASRRNPKSQPKGRQ